VTVVLRRKMNFGGFAHDSQGHSRGVRGVPHGIGDRFLRQAKQRALHHGREAFEVTDESYFDRRARGVSSEFTNRRKPRRRREGWSATQRTDELAIIRKYDQR